MLFAAMMRKTPAERVLMAFDMSGTARAIVWSTIPPTCPRTNAAAPSTSATTANHCRGKVRQ